MQVFIFYDMPLVDSQYDEHPALLGFEAIPTQPAAAHYLTNGRSLAKHRTEQNRTEQNRTEAVGVIGLTVVVGVKLRVCEGKATALCVRRSVRRRALSRQWATTHAPL
ncbi:hypothetical protein D9M71_831940 [compost metagenome]